jgi:uncharacterized protein YecE (DUF72 family)
VAWIGTSGWSYDHWDHVLYRPGTPPVRRLSLYTQEFDTVELNASFYRWPRNVSFASWRRRLPPAFRMSVKAPRGLTHAKRLYAPDVWVDRIAAYCVMSGAGLPCVLRATAPFVYVRLHGPDHEHLYGGSYSEQDLAWWADRIREWEGEGREVYAYFNNDGAGNAVRNARTLRAFLT